MNIKRIISTCTACLVVYAARPAEGPDSVAAIIIEHRTSVADIASLPFVSPVVNQWRFDSSLTDVTGRLYDENGDNPCLSPLTSDFGLGAATYTKYRTSTLWGHGRYTNGKLRDVRWNETADADLVYPYLLADSVGGDMRSEVYDFGAGYADSSGRWSWGGSLSYLARLEYRDVDPRPRNVSGTLDISLGGAIRVYRDYRAAVSLYWRRYKQSNDIDFKSEMGVDKIFHLTGLANHYTRFAGTGLSSSYDGYRYGISADIYPESRRGTFISAKVSRFTFRNLLIDMNKLPMARVRHNAFDIEAGWLAERWAVAAGLEIYRRHGIENVFGDASSGQYPLIASNTMYADNYVSAWCGSRWRSATEVKTSRPIFTLTAHLGWSHRTEAYILPYSYTEKSTLNSDISARFDQITGSVWIIGAEAGFSMVSPFNCAINLNHTDKETVGLVELTKARFEYDSRARFAPRCSVALARAFLDRYYIQGAASYSYTKSTSRSANLSSYTVTVSFMF